MKHKVFGNHLGRPTNQAKALVRNLVMEVVDHGRIETTLPKAKIVVGEIDRVINFAKKKTVAARREVVKILGGENKIVEKLFSDFSSRFKDRNSGYTRIIRTGKRISDTAEMAILELVDFVESAPAVVVEPKEVEEKKVIEAEVVKKPRKKVTKKTK